MKESLKQTTSKPLKCPRVQRAPGSKRFLSLCWGRCNKRTFHGPGVWLSGDPAFMLPKDRILSQSTARMVSPSHPFVQTETSFT